MPSIGNGFIGTIVDSDSIYMAGLYCFTRNMLVLPGSGRCRIQVPPALNMTISNSQTDKIELNTDEGMVNKYLSV